MRIFDKRRGIYPAAVLAVAAFLPWQAGLAADDAGSLDNIWADQGQHSQPQPAQSQQVVASPAAGVGAAAPMCTIEDVHRSTLVQKVGWPGIGPFKAGDGGPNDLVDPSGNHLRLTVSGDRVTVAELDILKPKPTNQDFLDIQMATDFLLEAVGTKGKKISGLNTEMEKNKQSILYKSDANPLSLNAGRYLVYIQRQPLSGSDQFNYAIRVNSRDVNKDVLHSAAQGHGSAPVPGDVTPTNLATATIPDRPPPSVPATSGSENMKEEFANVIRNWQKVKKTVVRQRQTELLSDVLRGKALQRQTDAVKWLGTKHWYYDMTPLGVTVYQYSELSPGTRYSVIAQVKESSKLIEDGSGKILKDTTDSYKVNYTIEKSGDRWFISDSAIVNATQPAQPPKPQNKAAR